MAKIWCAIFGDSLLKSIFKLWNSKHDLFPVSRLKDLLLSFAFCNNLNLFQFRTVSWTHQEIWMSPFPDGLFLTYYGQNDASVKQSVAWMMIKITGFPNILFPITRAVPSAWFPFEHFHAECCSHISNPLIQKYHQVLSLFTEHEIKMFKGVLTSSFESFLSSQLQSISQKAGCTRVCLTLVFGGKQQVAQPILCDSGHFKAEYHQTSDKNYTTSNHMSAPDEILR